MRLTKINEIRNLIVGFNGNMLLFIIKVNICTIVLFDLYIYKKRRI